MSIKVACSDSFLFSSSVGSVTSLSFNGAGVCICVFGVWVRGAGGGGPNESESA